MAELSGRARDILIQAIKNNDPDAIDIVINNITQEQFDASVIMTNKEKCVDLLAKKLASDIEKLGVGDADAIWDNKLKDYKEK